MLLQDLTLASDLNCSPYVYVEICVFSEAKIISKVQVRQGGGGGVLERVPLPHPNQILRRSWPPMSYKIHPQLSPMGLIEIGDSLAI